jgi:hypothetical protein
MMRVLLWVVLIIFLIGLAVVTGVFKLLIPG